ncbi:MAG: ABC transporter permease [Acidobacteriota bacterium]|nr:ABC transporter permease [Acidobacteriota bacterium]
MAFWQDIRYGVRLLFKRPSFTLLTLAALALGVGANTAIFSVVNAVVLRPLPYPAPEKLVAIWGTLKDDPKRRFVISVPNFEDLRAQTHSFDGVAAYLNSSSTLVREGGEPERLVGASVSADIFPMLGAQAARGRVFTGDEDREGAQPVVVLSDSAWRSRFGADPNVVGKTVSLNFRPTTVVGVMPAGFKFPVEPEKVEYWTPLGSDSTVVSRSKDRGIDFLHAVARVKQGVKAEEAQAELATVSARLEQQDPEHNFGLVFRANSLHEEIVGDIRPALVTLLCAVGFVLLIACANVANLLLARATERHKEIAIRTALGASRGRIVRQLLTESLLLSLAGGALGLLLASWGIDALLALIPADIPRAHEIGLDSRVLLFTLGVSVVAGLIFGLAPAVQVSRPRLNESLKDGARGTTAGSYRNRVRSLLVVSEIALSLVLLVGAGLLVKSFVRLQRVNPGFETSRALAVKVALPRARYDTPEKQAAFFSQALERAKAVPGVEAVGATNMLPLSGDNRTSSFEFEGQPPPAQGDEPEADERSVSPDYFRALSIPLLEGRAFTDRDGPTQPRVMIVNESFVRRYVRDGDPLGRRVKLGDDAWEIVGVVGDVRHVGLDAPTAPEMYRPFAQSPERWMNIVVRASSADPNAVSAGLRDVVRSIDRELYFPEVRPMSALLADSLARRRFNALLVGLFAAVALALAAVGIYGVISYTVTQRTHEIGVRMALGAQRGDVLRLIVRNGMALAAAGLALGLVGALACARLLGSLLFDVSASDPEVLGLITLLLALVSLAACVVPAYRASRVDPLIALRYE